MNQYKKHRSLFLLITILLVGSFFVPISLTQKVDYTVIQSSMIDEGQILYAPMYQTTTYLKDYTGTLNHTWPSSFAPGVMVRWFDDETA